MVVLSRLRRAARILSAAMDESSVFCLGPRISVGV